MLLHDAIADVLRSSSRPMTAREIADEVERRCTYRQAKGTPAPPSQIRLRMRNYSDMFVQVSDSRWGLR